MTLADLMVSDVSDVFINTDEHAETFVFHPVGGAARTISAIIDETTAPLVTGEAHQTRNRSIVVRCAEDATTGITRSEIQNSAWAEWLGDRWSNPRLLTRNNGWVCLEFESLVVETSGRVRRGGL